MVILLNYPILGFIVYVDEDDWPGLFLKGTRDLITNDCEPHMYIYIVEIKFPIPC